MLPKTKRLTTKEFDKVFKNNTSFRSENLILLSPKRSELSGKFAVVVSKKTYSRRVDRNKLRRIIYNVVKEVLGGGGLVKSGIIIVNKKSLLLSDPTRTRNEVQTLVSG